MIVLSDFSYEWFYIGIEDQLYITIRFIIIKLIQVILIFLCVKRAEDFIIYAGISVGLSGFSTIFNILRLKRYIYFIPIRQLNIRRHIKTIFTIFITVVATNIYQHLDVIMVGIMIGNYEVGLYTATNKLVRIIISVVTSLAAVMIPRIENSLKNENVFEYKKILIFH